MNIEYYNMYLLNLVPGVDTSSARYNISRLHKSKRCGEAQLKVRVIRRLLVPT